MATPLAAAPQRRLGAVQAHLAAASAAPVVTVALVSHLGGPHVTAYIDGLAAATAVTRVALVSPDGAWVEECQAALGDKLGAIYTDIDAMFASETPILAVVAYEAVLGPPIVRAVLEHGCHVMAEKPSAVSAEDIHQLAALADAKGAMLMLALANRLLPEVIEAKRLVDSGAIGSTDAAPPTPKLDFHAHCCKFRLKWPFVSIENLTKKWPFQSKFAATVRYCLHVQARSSA